MKNTQHTRGPWKVRGGNVIESFSNVNVAKAWMTDKEEECANARLIAAAPDLLSTLEKLLACASKLDQSATHDGLQNCEAIAQAREALLKAKGEA